MSAFEAVKGVHSHSSAYAARPCQMAITPKWATELLAHLIDVRLVCMGRTGGARSPSAADPHWHGGNQR
jgi:hypothetical protein